MPFHLRQRARIAWIAVIAMLMSTLAPTLMPTLMPTITHAVVAPATALAWQMAIGDVCSVDSAGVGIGTDSSTRVNERAPAESPSGGHRSSVEHCPYCLTHAPHFPLPHAPPRLAPSMTVSSSLPRLFLHAPATLFPWLAAQPRAPPSIV